MSNKKDSSSRIFETLREKAVCLLFGQWGAFSFTSSLFILDVTTQSQKDHKLLSATYNLCSKKIGNKKIEGSPFLAQFWGLLILLSDSSYTKILQPHNQILTHRKASYHSKTIALDNLYLTYLHTYFKIKVWKEIWISTDLYLFNLMF